MYPANKKVILNIIKNTDFDINFCRLYHKVESSMGGYTTQMMVLNNPVHDIARLEKYPAYLRTFVRLDICENTKYSVITSYREEVTYTIIRD